MSPLDGHAEGGMNDIRCNLRQGHENECPPVHPGMGNDQVFFPRRLLLAEEEQVQVYHAGSPSRSVFTRFICCSMSLSSEKSPLAERVVWISQTAFTQSGCGGPPIGSVR